MEMTARQNLAFFGRLYGLRGTTLREAIDRALSPLGGLWWPLEIVGPTMRRVAAVTPTGWAMEAVNSMLAFGAGAAEVAPYAAAFAAVFLVSLALAARRLSP